MKALKQIVTVQPGGRIEVRSPDLTPGTRAEVTIVPEAAPEAAKEPLKPAWQMAVEIGAAVPPRVWEKVPTDLAQNLDHYLYGAPKNG
ncbi:MAG: hypothetical protein AB1405_16210 [Bdellovibrionota bacterium]